MPTSIPTRGVDRDVVEAARLLSRAAVFSGVPASCLASLAPHAVTRHLGAGDHLFRQGETGTSMYVLGQGRIRLYLNDQDGVASTLAVLHPPSSFGELAVFDGGPRSASAMAVEPSMVVGLPGAVLRRAWRADPDLADNLLRSLAALVRQATDERSLLVFHDLAARVARCLLDDAARHSDGVAWLHGQPVARLAARVGGSEAAVRRILAVFARNGLIHDHDGAGLVIVERNLLERLATSGL